MQLKQLDYVGFSLLTCQKSECNTFWMLLWLAMWWMQRQQLQQQPPSQQRLNRSRVGQNCDANAVCCGDDDDGVHAAIVGRQTLMDVTKIIRVVIVMKFYPSFWANDLQISQ